MKLFKRYEDEENWIEIDFDKEWEEKLCNAYREKEPLKETEEFRTPFAYYKWANNIKDVM